MTTHQQKKLERDGAARLPRPLRPAADRRRRRPTRLLQARRRQRRDALPARAPRALGGYAARRAGAARRRVAVPPLESLSPTSPLHAEGKEMSTTMAFVRMLGNLLKDPHAGPARRADRRRRGAHLRHGQPVPPVGIYAPLGQLYEPEDAGSMLSYREATDGQILEEGITEAGALSSWTAAATRYSMHGVPMLPFYIYYSMFGFQRVGDLIWAAADQRARGFLLGATAGRTTLGGEGLQHQDGTSHVRRRDGAQLPGLRPGLRRRARGDPRPRHAPDAGARRGRLLLRHGDERELRPAFACRRGARGRDCAACIASPARAACAGAPAGIGRDPAARCSRPGSCSRDDWQVETEVWSVTSFSELARDAREVERGESAAHRAMRRAPVTWNAASPAMRRSSPPPTTCAPVRSSSRPICRRRSRRWAPTASAAATPARRCGGFSRSIASTSRWRHCGRWHAGAPWRARRWTRPSAGTGSLRIPRRRGRASAIPGSRRAIPRIKCWSDSKGAGSSVRPGR